jgi:hypothetical protein
MNLENDKRLNIQLRLDFSSVPTGEARRAEREDIELRVPGDRDHSFQTLVITHSRPS